MTQLAEEFISNKINAVVFMFAYLHSWRKKGIVRGSLSGDAAITIFSSCDSFHHLAENQSDPNEFDDDDINEAEFKIRVQMCLDEKWEEARRRTVRIS